MPSAHALYMRGWAKKNRARLRDQYHARIAQLLVSLPEEQKPCSTCGATITVTASRKAKRDYRCAGCKRLAALSYQTRVQPDPVKARAHHNYEEALRKGQLLRATHCEQCGASPAEGHHEDYTKPREVRWLCRRCHLAVHHPYRQVNAVA